MLMRVLSLAIWGTTSTFPAVRALHMSAHSGLLSCSATSFSRISHPMLLVSRPTDWAPALRFISWSLLAAALPPGCCWGETDREDWRVVPVVGAVRCRGV